jgi:L-asparaginase
LHPSLNPVYLKRKPSRSDWIPARTALYTKTGIGTKLLHGEAMNKMILILTTGGTIDKIYFDALSDYQVGEPYIITNLQEMHIGVSYRVEQLFRKDSLEISDDDRRLIHDAVARAPESRILITHGTDTMTLTARALHTIAGKTIVLTGALQPARFSGSDALFNIGGALVAVQLLEPGVYITMHGTVYSADQVRKDRHHNRFTVIDSVENDSSTP